jgi:MinD superfamily P-loop ATPase
MQLAVISGKGGTGKSCVSAALATLSEKVVLADCDVDAANLYIFFQPEHEEELDIVGGQKAVIDPSVCANCGLCIPFCRFGALSIQHEKVTVSEVFCDGCKLCIRVCPFTAISMLENNQSRMYSGSFRNGKMVYGRLAPGEENSGKLVNLVREKARQLSGANNLPTIILDGPPGIGCPVISTVTGIDHAVVVTEPTLSALSDLQRILELCSAFSLKTWVIINKYDLNEELSTRIERHCHDHGIKVAGKLLFNPKVVDAMVHRKSMTEWDPSSDFAGGVQAVYDLITGDRQPSIYPNP